MRRLKSVIPIAGIMLLILSAASMYVSLRFLSEIRPAEDYGDRGVLAFRPYAVYPVQASGTGTNSRTNPAGTVYMVYYRATDGSGYQWSEEVSSKDRGRKVVEAGETVKRRVLNIPGEGTYITVEPEQTAESYTEGLREKYTRIVGFGTLYIVFYGTVLILTKLLRRLRENRTENVETERFGPEITEPKPRRRGRAALLVLLAVALLLSAFLAANRRPSDSAAADYDRSEDSGPGAAPVNDYLPPLNEEGYCVFDLPPSLMGNKTPEELLADWQESLESVDPEDMDRLAWTELRASENGGVSYLCTPEQYRRMKQAYYAAGTRILPSIFGMDPGEIIKRISYEEIDGDGIPWGVGIWIDQTEFSGGGLFSDFIATFVPMTVLGRYQLMCGVPADEWAVHVTLRDAETDSVLFEKNYTAEGE